MWTVHPLATEAVVYVTHGTELLMALFYLATLYASLRYWTGADESQRLVWGVTAGSGLPPGNVVQRGHGFGAGDGPAVPAHLSDRLVRWLDPKFVASLRRDLDSLAIVVRTASRRAAIGDGWLSPGRGGAGLVGHAMQGAAVVSEAVFLAVALVDPLRVDLSRHAGGGLALGATGCCAGRGGGLSRLATHGGGVRARVDVRHSLTHAGRADRYRIAVERRMYLPLAAIVPLVVGSGYCVATWAAGRASGRDLCSAARWCRGRLA